MCVSRSRFAAAFDEDPQLAAWLSRLACRTSSGRAARCMNTEVSTVVGGEFECSLNTIFCVEQYYANKHRVKRPDVATTVDSGLEVFAEIMD